MSTGGQPASVLAGTVTGVSRGIGKTQQAILAELTDAKDYRWLDIATLTERIGCSGRPDSIRRCARWSGAAWS